MRPCRIERRGFKDAVAIECPIGGSATQVDGIGGCRNQPGVVEGVVAHQVVGVRAPGRVQGIDTAAAVVRYNVVGNRVV